MNLPNAEKARIDPRKLRDYALNPQHVSGRYKAVFFAQMGYTAEARHILERDILEQHLSQPAEPGGPSLHGRKYAIIAPLRGPSGEIRQVTNVSILRPKNDFAELVTIDPADRRRRT